MKTTVTPDQNKVLTPVFLPPSFEGGVYIYSLPYLLLFHFLKEGWVFTAMKHIYKYNTMDHKGGFEESLATLRRLSKTTFDDLIKSKIYIFYGYDERINANRYVLDRMIEDIGFPTWLIEYLE